VVITEGRKREVRRLWEAVGVRVSRLIRVRFGPVILPPRLARGRWQELDGESRTALLALAGLSEGRAAAGPRAPRRPGAAAGTSRKPGSTRGAPRKPTRPRGSHRR